MSTSSAPHQRVSRYLKRYLRVRSAGEPLPSFRQIMGTCQVGPTTVRAAVDELAQEGLIEVRPQRGLFVAIDRTDSRREALRLRHVDLVYFHGVSSTHRIRPFHDELVRELTCQATGQGLDLRVHLIGDHERADERVEPIAAHPDCEGAIVINLSEPRLLHYFDEASIPFINLFPAIATDLPPNTLAVDPDELVGMQIAHLVELGHRRIGYLHKVRAGTFHRDLVLRREAFYRICLDRQLPVRSEWVRYAGYDPAVREPGIGAMLALAERPTALICADESLPEVYRAATGHGLQVGRDLAVVGTNDEPIAAMLYPPATSVAVPRDGAAAMAIAMLNDVVQSLDDRLPPRHLPIVLKVRETSQPPRA